MPACILKNTIFLHNPKTGGEWITKCILDLGLGVKAEHPQVPPGRLAHLAIHEFKAAFPQYRDWPIITFVRHPLGWYRSLWQYRMTTGWTSECFDYPHRSDDFETYMRNFLKHFPGYYSNHLLGYVVGDPTVDTVSVGRHERLVDDFVALMETHEGADGDRIRAIPPVNRSDPSFQATYSPQLLEALAASEWYAFEKFHYTVADYPQRLPQTPLAV